MEKLQELILELEKSIDMDDRRSDSSPMQERARFLSLWLGPLKDTAGPLADYETGSDRLRIKELDVDHVGDVERELDRGVDELDGLESDEQLDHVDGVELDELR